MHTYKIIPRPDSVGGGWNLKLLEDGEEQGGGVFPVDVSSPEKGIDWWNSIGEKERALWLDEAKSARPADAWHAWQIAEAYDKAHAEGMDWVNSHSPDNRAALWPSTTL